MFARFPFTARRFFQRRLALDEARKIVRERMEQREENFLRVVERSVYGFPHSPYLALLKLAGCAMGDLRALVKQRGLEGALGELRTAGVYVSFEEFKGRKPIVRNGHTIPVAARDFDNPYARRDYATETSGSTGLAMGVNQDLDYLAACAAAQMLTFSAFDILGAPLVIWSPFLPGPALANIFQTAHMGIPCQHWFSPLGWRDSKYWVKYALATLYMVFWIQRFGFPLPVPKIAKLDNGLTVAKQIKMMLAKDHRCLFITGMSRALRVSLAAKEAGIDLTGTVILCGGEPETAAKVQALEQVGARCLPRYGMIEGGVVGLGCAKPKGVGDMHLLRDTMALITHPHPVAELGTTVPAFNLTTLLESTPKVMLNYQIDDYGVVEERACECELGGYGYTTHLREIRSYDKLVGEGATLIGNDMVRILEQVLPNRFGGTALDYQLMEQEDEHGFTRLWLVIAPRVEIADEGAVIATVLNALRDSSPMADAARAVWQQAQTIQVKRTEPVWTTSGKLLPLHVERRVQKP